MGDTDGQVRFELAVASRILANEGVLDAFGHVSIRDPANSGRYLLARSRSPRLVEPGDFIEYTLDSEPVRKPDVQQFVERVIHGCIYQARPDVTAFVITTLRRSCRSASPACRSFGLSPGSRRRSDDSVLEPA